MVLELTSGHHQHILLIAVTLKPWKRIFTRQGEHERVDEAAITRLRSGMLGWCWIVMVAPLRSQSSRDRGIGLVDTKEGDQ